MQCSTGAPVQQPSLPVGQEKWEELLCYLPPSLDLEATAHAGKALQRRRKIQGARELLRLVLGYAVCDCSLRLLGVWCALWGVALSKTAVRKRLGHCRLWLGVLVTAVLQARQIQFPSRPGLRLRLMDASVITRPGSEGSDWRLHLSLDMGQSHLAGVELTDSHGPETLVRFPLQEGEIRIADRGYAFASGLGPVLAAGGQIVTRINWQNLALEEENGPRLDVAQWLGGLGRGAAQERPVWLSTREGRFPLRLAACPLPEQAAEAARRRARRAARKKKHTVDARTLLAAGFVLLLTNLPGEDWPVHEVLELYRLRWQVEMLIKRLKSLLAFDGLRAQDPELAQTYLLGKILGALLVEEMSGQAASYSPGWWDDLQRPLSPWRVTALCQSVLIGLIRGPVDWPMILAALPRLRQFLGDEPRKRRSQWALARVRWRTLSSY